MSLIKLLNTTTSPGHHLNKIFGVVVGIVRDIKDPDGLGRVKVDFPWLAEEAEAVAIISDDDRAHSYWARIANLMAGSGRGTYFIPEVGDEVLVAFEHGDPDRPFIIGALWNKDDPPPERMDGEGKNHVRSIRSRSGHVITLDDNVDDQKACITIQSQGGHQIVLDDDSNQGKIELKTNAGHTIILDDAGGTVTLADKAGNKLVLDANANSLTVQTSGNQDQSVGGNLTINVTGTATISAPSGVTIDSTSIKLGSAAALTLVNDTFLDIFNTHFHVGNMGAPTSPPTIPAIKNVQSTIFTKGGLIMGQEFLGAGWKFPVQLNDLGEIALSRYEEDVREAIWIILSTAPGERLMRPDFGSGIHEFVFAPNNARTAGLVRFHVEEALTRWEPRIDLLEVKVQPDVSNPALLLISIDYRVRTTDSRFNLVYPFYLERGETT